MADKIYPFFAGTQAADWESSNCDRCTKGTPCQDGTPTCDIQKALFEAMFDDGSISEEIAKRMGLLDNPNTYCWPCGEVDWTEEWKAEYRARHPESCTA